MPSWILVPALVSLRNEFNTLAPSRDKSSDGSIGDEAHASSSSDHNPDETGNTPYEDADDINEVHAIDVSTKLNKSGWTMGKAVDIIVTRHREGLDNRLQNVIYSRRIWSDSWGWTAREYTSSSPHEEHAHFSGKYTNSAESNTKPWGLLEAEGINGVSLPVQGDSSQDVKFWQLVHNDVAKYFNPDLTLVTVDGDYGPNTAWAFATFYTAISGKDDYQGELITGWMAKKYLEYHAYINSRVAPPSVRVATK